MEIKMCTLSIYISKEVTKFYKYFRVLVSLRGGHTWEG
jgi:hypothetical protein